MNKTLLLMTLLLGALTSTAQQKVNFQTACHPEDVKHYDTKTLRERFVMEKVMVADEINLTYSHYDRFIFGGAMPVTKTLKLENFSELGLDVDPTIKDKYFLYNREIGIVNGQRCQQGGAVPLEECCQACQVLPQLGYGPPAL